jgi:hypothetical protein
MSRSYSFVIEPTESRERRVRLVHRNGKTVMASPVGFKRLNKAISSVEHIMQALKAGDCSIAVIRVSRGRPKKN